MKTTTVFVLAASCGLTLVACAPVPSADDRADLTTGSHIARKYPPGTVPNSDVQVVKPTAGDKAYGEATVQPLGSRDPNR